MSTTKPLPAVRKRLAVHLWGGARLKKKEKIGASTEERGGYLLYTGYLGHIYPTLEPTAAMSTKYRLQSIHE